MVLYFSATGNTEFIAQEIARRTGDECINLLECIKMDDHSPLHSEKPFIICAPVYVCEIPRFMSKYLKAQTFTGSRDVYFIFTSGGYAGISGVLTKAMFRKKKMNYLGHAEFTMPRNYVANDSYPMLERAEAEKRILDSYRRLDGVCADISARKQLKARHVFLLESIITLPFNPIWCKWKLTAKEFYAKDSCSGCGKCVKLCPLNNIRLSEKKPIWGTACTHCMACIGNCPKDAIEYGTISQGKDRYTFEKYRDVIKKSVEE